MSTPVLRGAYVGLLAASNAVVSKHGARRAAAPFTSVSKHLLPPNLRDAVRLLSAGRDESDPQHRLARATAISALQALDKVDTPYDFRPGGHVEKLLTRRERNSLRDRKKQLAASPLTKLCRYCTLFQELVHDSAEVPVEVVNHGARIQGDFDLATSISKAGIVDYQLFLPQELADQALTGAHPLFWEDTAPEIFKETSPAIHLGTKPFRTWDTIRSHDRGAETDAWERRATNNPEEYIYEHAEWPWNEEISTKVENILRITAFADATTPAKDLSQYLGTHRPEEPTSVTERVRAFLRDDKPSLKPLLTGHQGAKVWPQDEVRFLNYDYSLKSCLRSSYGIGWEEGGGLNVDDGGVMGCAVHYSHIPADFVAHLTEDDFAHLGHALRRRCARPDAPSSLQHPLVDAAIRSVNDLLSSWGTINADAKLRTIQDVARAFKELWPRNEDPWLVTISSDKRLRYSLPTRGSVEFWSLLTWMAPAMLFAFINRAVCQLPHYLLIDGKRFRDRLAEGS